MQEKKNKRLALLLLVLIVVTTLVYWLGLKEKTIEVNKDLFRLTDYKKIDKIVMESGRRKVELTFNGSRWKVNNRYDADRNLINQLFATFQQAEPKRQAPASIKDSVNTWLNEKGIQVSLFSGQNLEQRFLAGGNDLKKQTWFKEPDGNSYLVAIPGYRIYLAQILELTENQWRNKYVFNFNQRNFESLRVEFPGKTSENFRVSIKDGFLGIDELPKTDTAKLYTFLDKVALLTVNDYLEPGKVTDSLMNITPFIILTVSDIAKKEYPLKIFREYSGLVPALIGENQGVVFDPLKIQPIIRPKSFFKVP